jgi:uncharacterized tellurite resistance protein B-like protein
MALVNLQSLKSLMTSTTSADDDRENYKTLLFTILTKASRVDLHSDGTEIELIQKIMFDYTGETFDAGSIRAEAIAQAQGESLRPVAKLAAKLPESMRVLAIDALASVIRADDNISYAEIDYFNAVAGAMRLSFADVAGLLQD